uniref:Uncharacterized protein n=1 Tax=Rhizophora mucronata TaxID=61149 RepID=A0A2P2PIG5_RHIMU
MWESCALGRPYFVVWKS